MSSPEFPGLDPARSRLRATVATIEHELSRLPKEATAEGDNPRQGLLAAFADLVGQLALGPEPEVRQCPACGQYGMKAATLCGFCWTKLTPLKRRHFYAQ
jgi:hypothetical protein